MVFFVKLMYSTQKMWALFVYADHHLKQQNKKEDKFIYFQQHINQNVDPGHPEILMMMNPQSCCSIVYQWKLCLKGLFFFKLLGLLHPEDGCSMFSKCQEQFNNQCGITTQKTFTFIIFIIIFVLIYFPLITLFLLLVNKWKGKSC